MVILTLSNSPKISNFEKVDIKFKANEETKWRCLVDSSRNIQTLDDTHLAVVSSKRGESLIARLDISGSDLEISLKSRFSSLQDSSFMPQRIKFEELKPQDTEGTELSKELLNYLDQQLPELLFFLYLLIRVYNEILLKGQSLNESICMKLFAELLSDPSLKRPINSQISKAILSLANNLEAVKKDAVIRNLIDDINPSAQSLWTQSLHKEIRSKLQRSLFSSKPKEKAIESLEQDLKTLLNSGALSNENALRIERIFHRATRLREYHRPLNDEIVHRTRTVDPLFLIFLESEKLQAYVQSEDTGILRDLAILFGKVITEKAKRTPPKTMTETEIIQHNKESQEDIDWEIWIDKDKDKLLKISNAQNKLDETFYIVNELLSYMESVVTCFCIIVLEISHREQLDIQTLESATSTETDFKGQYLNESLSKWTHLKSTQPGLWDLILSCNADWKQLENKAIQDYIENGMEYTSQHTEQIDSIKDVAIKDLDPIRTDQIIEDTSLTAQADNPIITVIFNSDSNSKFDFNLL